MTTLTDANGIATALDGFATLPDWLAAGMDGDRVRVAIGRATGADIRRVDPERLRAKGDEWVARYRVALRDGSDEDRDIVLVGTLWPPTVDRRPMTQRVDVGFGQAGWHGYLPDLLLELRVESSDEALPALPTLVDAGRAAALIERVLGDAGYGDVRIADCRPAVVRYKPGSRCTVVVGVDYAEADRGLPDPIVLKTHQGDKGAVAWAAMRALWERPVAHEGLVALAEPLAYIPDDRILVQGPVPEELTLKELARTAIAVGDSDGLDRLRAELRKTARALAAIHSSGANFERSVTFDDELAEVTGVVERLATSVPDLREAARPLLASLDGRAAEAPPDPLVPAHHDFRPAQVLLHEGSVGFIDFDGASMAEPALDLGRFRAKLRDIGISTVAAASDAPSGAVVTDNVRLLDVLCDDFLAAYREHAEVSLERVLLWESCDLFTALLHAWTKVRLARVRPRLAVLQHQLENAGRYP